MTTTQAPDPFIELHLEASIVLRVDEVWPDGDVPEEITADVIAELLRRDSKSRTLEDWNLIPALDGTLYVSTRNPAYSDSAPLPGFPPISKFISTRADVWTGSNPT